MTRTYAVMQLSKAAYDEIKGKLLDAGYNHAIHENSSYGVVLDMHGIAVAEDPGKCKAVLSPIAFVSDIDGNKSHKRCGASLVLCSCGAKWCLDHQPNPLVCPQCGKRPSDEFTKNK